MKQGIGEVFLGINSMRRTYSTNKHLNRLQISFVIHTEDTIVMSKFEEKNDKRNVLTCYHDYRIIQSNIVLVIDLLKLNVNNTSKCSSLRKYIVSGILGLFAVSNFLSIFLNLDVNDLWFIASALLIGTGTFQIAFKVFSISRSSEAKNLLNWIDDLHLSYSWRDLGNFVELRLQRSLQYVRITIK